MRAAMGPAAPSRPWRPGCTWSRGGARPRWHRRPAGLSARAEPLAHVQGEVVRGLVDLPEVTGQVGLKLRGPGDPPDVGGGEEQVLGVAERLVPPAVHRWRLPRS